MNRSDIIAKQKEFLFPSVATFYNDPLPLARGEGQYVWDVDGKRYMDFFAGIEYTRCLASFSVLVTAVSLSLSRSCVLVLRSTVSRLIHP